MHPPSLIPHACPVGSHVHPSFTDNAGGENVQCGLVNAGDR